MKKIVTLLLTLVLLFSMAACGTKPSSSSRSRGRSTREDDPSQPASSATDDREGITIIIPAYVFAVFEFFEIPIDADANPAAVAQRYVNHMQEDEGVISITLNTDNSVTLVATEEFMQEHIDIYVNDIDFLVSDYTSGIIGNLSKMVYSDNYRECEITLDASDYQAHPSECPFLFTHSFLWVQVYLGISDPSITFTFIDSATGGFLGTFTYPEAV